MADEKKESCLKLFDGFGITQPLLEGVLGAPIDEWTTAHQDWLADRYYECDAGDLDAKKLASLSFDG
jgi:hypothetical protein